MPYKYRELTCLICGSAFTANNPARQYCSPRCMGQGRTGEKHYNYKGGSVHPVSGYRQISVNGRSYLEHRYVMEQHIGRPLLSTEVVHHKDGDRLNNDISNLELHDTIRSHAEVHRTHYRTPTHRQCSRCREIKLKSEFYVHCSRCKPCESLVRFEKQGRVRPERPLSRPGSACGTAKLTEAQVMEIRRRYQEGETAPKLGREFGVSGGTAWNIIRGKTWKHVPILHIGGTLPRRAKLTVEQASRIKQMHRDGYKVSKIASDHSISVQTVWAIIKGSTWKNAP